MPASFNFRIFNGSNPDTQYNTYKQNAQLGTLDSDIHAKTFYILNNGKGYLGDQLMFDATRQLQTVTDMTAANYTGNDTSSPTTKAVVDYVAQQILGIEGNTVKFFRNVVGYTITAADLTNAQFSYPQGTTAGQNGLLFTADVDNDTGGETFIFMPLADSITTSDMESAINDAVDSWDDDSYSISVNVNSNNGRRSLNVRINSGETNLKINQTTGGLYIDTKSAIPNSGLDDYIPNIAAVRQFVNSQIQAAMANVVTYTEET